MNSNEAVKTPLHYVLETMHIRSTPLYHLTHLNRRLRYNVTISWCEKTIHPSHDHETTVLARSCPALQRIPTDLCALRGPVLLRRSGVCDVPWAWARLVGHRGKHVGRNSSRWTGSLLVPHQNTCMVSCWKQEKHKIIVQFILKNEEPVYNVWFMLFKITWSQQGKSVSCMTILFLNFQITRSDIWPHIKWAVSLVIAYGHFNLSRGFVRILYVQSQFLHTVYPFRGDSVNPHIYIIYMGVNMLTLSPPKGYTVCKNWLWTPLFYLCTVLTGWAL